MAGKILVPLGTCDRINNVVPYLEEIARPGMRVVFLIRYPTEGFYLWLARLEGMQTGVQTALAAKKIAFRNSWSQQRQVAEAKVFSACKALHQKGVETTVDLHADSPRQAVKRYTCNGNVELIITPARMGLGALRLLRWSASFVGVFAPSAASPVLLQHPRHAS